MNGLSKIIIFALFIILIVQGLSYFCEQSKRTYTPRLKNQLKQIYEQLLTHVDTAKSILGNEMDNRINNKFNNNNNPNHKNNSVNYNTNNSTNIGNSIQNNNNSIYSILSHSQLLVAFQQISYAANQCDVLFILAPVEDLKSLIGCDPTPICQEIQILQRQVFKELQKRNFKQ